MTTDSPDDVVVDQYERWRYPEPITDLPAWLENNWQWFDPSHAHRIMWPDRGYQPGMQILVAGCGTNQAATIAYTNPDADIVAIDVSQPSLDHEHVLKDRYGLRNLELRRLPIEDVTDLDRDFDLVISTGVLHHLVDPQAGMNALASVLRHDGVLALMLYARNGRIGVEMMESVFADLRLRQDESSLALVRQALDVLPPDHPLRSYLTIAPDLGFDAGLVDTFLHGRERSYTVDDCLALVNASGLIFQDWFLRASYEPPRTSGNAFLDVVANLPDQQRWSIMERIYTRNGCHFFLACRADRASSTYCIDLDAPNASTLVPQFRHRCGIDGTDVVGPGYRYSLTDTQTAFARGIDGFRSVADLAERADVAADFALALTRELRNRDVVSIQLPATESGPGTRHRHG